VVQHRPFFDDVAVSGSLDRPYGPPTGPGLSAETHPLTREKTRTPTARSGYPDAVLVPDSLPVVTELGRIPAARPWLASLPSLIESVRVEFDLRLDAPLHGGSCSWVAPAWLPDGTKVIVKIGWPHREMLTEPAALRLWGGRGTVRLLAEDPVRHALILQRCVPGEPLASSLRPADERLRIGCAVLRQLWAVAPAGSFEDLRTVLAEWADLTEERLARLRPDYDLGLVAHGVRLMRELPSSAGRSVLLHGDFNPGNVLSDGDRWLAIDPKPMIGDPAYDPWPLLEQVDDPFPQPRSVLRDRVQLLADELELDAQRIVDWSLARRVETALWAAHHDDVPGGAHVMSEARALADISR
jgi:streptomycin 6-kinase